MDSAGPAKINMKLSSQRRFFQWAVKWFYTQEEEDTSKKPDLPSLVMLLQAAGFQLRQFEKQKLVEGDNETEKESIKVIISCGTSQMKAILEMDGIDCQCPNEESESKGGSLWSICGHAPTTNESGCSSKYEESGSNLLPSIPRGVNKVVRDVVYRLLKIINEPPSINSLNSNHNPNVYALGNMEHSTDFKKLDSMERFSRSRTQPNITSICENSINSHLLASKNLYRSTFNTNNPTMAEIPNNDAQIRVGTLQRQKTWDLDVELEMQRKFATLGIASTPVEDMNTSLGPTSITSEDESIGFIDYVVKAYRNLDKAVNFLARKAPLTASTMSLNDQSFVIPTTPSEMSESSSPRSLPRPRSTCSVPTRLTQKISPAQKLNRKNISTPTSRKSADSLPGTTSLRRQSSNISSGPKKAIPSRLTTSRMTTSRVTTPRVTTPRVVTPKVQNTSNLPASRLSAAKGRGISSPSMNMPLNNKVLVKNQLSPDVNKQGAPKKSNIGANTSLRSSLTNSKPLSQSSTGTLGTKYGLTKNKKKEP